MLTGKNITLGVTGSIAAYKAVLILRELVKLSADVTVVLTRHAREFVSPLTFEVLSGRGVITDLFGEPRTYPRHVNLAQDTDLLLVAPATANILGKFTYGIADDFLSTFYLAVSAPLIIAPAMNDQMYRNTVVQENIRLLHKRGIWFVLPEAGELACGGEGQGRLASVEEIVGRVVARLTQGGSLTGRRILVTAGPTREPIDHMRFISNRSSGKMGYALAGEAAARGAAVTLISGSSGEPIPPGVRFIRVETAAQMRQAVLAERQRADALIMAAAVADYTAANPAKGKLRRKDARLQIELTSTVDILAEVGRDKGKLIVVGFAAEVENLAENAAAKLKSKNLDLIVANDISQLGVGPEVDTNQVTIIDRKGTVEELPLLPKTEVAAAILDRLELILKTKLPSNG